MAQPLAGVVLLRRLPVILIIRSPLRLSLGDASCRDGSARSDPRALLPTYVAQKGFTDTTIWAAGSIVIAASTLPHGVTTLPGRHVYQRLIVDDGPGDT